MALLHKKTDTLFPQTKRFSFGVYFINIVIT